MKKFILPLLLLFAVPAAFMLLTPGFYEPQDLHHIADIYQMVRAFQSGQLPPRLGPDYMFGYGYPLFNFYYPLPFYLGAAFFALVGSLTVSFKLVFIFSIFISVIGMYFFLREFLDRWPAFVGAFLFMYTPYRAVQIYVRGAIGEALALSLLPFFAWALIRLLKKPNLANTLLAGLAGGIYILSHNYFWALSAPILVVLLFVVNRRFEIKTLLWCLLGGGIALALSAYWWLPALIEQKLVATTTPFPLLDHFPFLKQLIVPFWGYGASVWGPNDGMSFQIGVVNLAVIVVLLILLIFRFQLIQKLKLLPLTLYVILGFAGYFFMMNMRSYPIWRLIPFYNFVQFPWRLLAYTAFLTAIAAGIITQTANKLLLGKKRYLAGVLVIGISFALTISYFRPSQKFYKTDNAYLHRFFANRSLAGETPGVSPEYLLYSEDYLQLPNWTKHRPSTLPQSKIFSTKVKIGNIQEVNPVFWQADVVATGSATLIFHELYFPGWTAMVNGQPVQLEPTGDVGEIKAVVNQTGNYTIQFRWLETSLRRGADYLSLATLIFLLPAFYLAKRNEK